MKRIGFIAAILVLAFVITIMQSNDPTIAAEKPKGLQYSNTFSWDVTLDTTADSVFDTTFSTSGGGHAFLFTELDPYSSVSGYIKLEVSAVDTGDAAADIPDTSKDSLGVCFYTDWGDSTYKKLVYKISNIKPTTTAATNYFSIPVDSIIGTRLWPKFTVAVGDSDYSVTRASAAITYKATVKWLAKP